MRITCSKFETNIFPSPIRPVFAADCIASIALSNDLSLTTNSIFTFGRKSTIYSAPRYN